MAVEIGPNLASVLSVTAVWTTTAVIVWVLNRKK